MLARLKDWSKCVYLQVVGEKLSLHVLANYEEFVRGVNEVASIEKDLQVCSAPAAGSTDSNCLLCLSDPCIERFTPPKATSSAKAMLQRPPHKHNQQLGYDN